ncbi:MAG TPA: hypothetical protein VG779_03615 [Actinomycetota bacterium]|nr:hypothetical protein [Actinomycetota bacterium]
MTVTGVGDGEGVGGSEGAGAVVGAGTGAFVGAVAGAGPVMGAVDAGTDGAVVEPPTAEEMLAAAAGWVAAGWGATEPVGLCMGTEPEPAVVVLGRAVGVAAGIPAGLWTARGRET